MRMNGMECFKMLFVYVLHRPWRVSSGCKDQTLFLAIGNKGYFVILCNPVVLKP